MRPTIVAIALAALLAGCARNGGGGVYNPGGALTLTTEQPAATPTPVQPVTAATPATVPTISVAPGTPNFKDATGGTGLRLADDEIVTVPIGFTVRAFGIEFTSLRISSNGYVAFADAPATFLNTDLPSALAPRGLLAVLWADWAPPPSGNWVFTAVQGEAPNRDFIVEWVGAQSPLLAPGTGVTFEVVLHEQGGAEFQYLNTTIGNAQLDKGASATVGVQNLDASSGSRFSLNGSVPIESNTAVQVTF